MASITSSKTSNQKRSSTTIVLLFIAAVAAMFGGSRLYSDWRVSHIQFADIPPKDVNIVGINMDKGFRIIVANQIAQLVRVDPKDQGINSDHTQAQDTAKARVPMRDMLKALQGDEQALGAFVMVLSDMKQDDLPPIRVIWTEEDLRKAMAGDPALTAKLEKDLNVKLDGTPLQEFRPDAMWNGIVVQAQVPVHVNLGGTIKLLHAPILFPFKADLMANLERELGEKAKLDRDTMRIHYIKMAEAELAKPQRQNVVESLKGLLSADRLASLAVDPERVLKSATVLVNEDYITKAELGEGVAQVAADDKIHKMYDIKLNLTQEGSDRLWKYSKGKVGSQLLFVSNGVAIAAPRIQHELSEGELQISQLEDYALAKDAVETLNKKRATRP